MITRKHTDWLLITIFLAVICTPLAVQLAGSATRTESHEKRSLAKMPVWPEAWAALCKWPTEFTAYYGDHFGLRSKLIRWHAVAVYRGLGMSPSDKVLVGRDGWLYYADDYSLEDYRSLVPFKQEELEQWKKVLEERQDWLAQRGAKFMLVLACDKYVIYPEFLPAGMRRTDAPYRVDVLADYLKKNSRVPVVSLHEPLVEAKKHDRLYQRTDTHWNDRGAYVGYREIVKSTHDLQPVEVTTPGWDLARMMGLDDIIHEQDLRLVPRQARRARVVEQDRPDALWNNGRVALECAGAPGGKMVMFRDSFGSALVPMLAEHFKRSLFLWQYDLDTKVIEQEKPDLVILLITSRRMQWYQPANPPLPAKSD